jgi:hypothetical protein
VSPVLADDPFIVLGPNVKTVFTKEVIDGFSVTLATVTISETTPDAITVKRQTYAVVPDGIGGFERRVTQEKTVATPDPLNPGAFNVKTTTEKLTTPVDSNDSPIGATTTDTTEVNEEGVEESDLDLPPSTEFFPFDGELDIPVVISPA